MKQEFILEPLWITKGSYFDAEYFDYILLDASMKYKKEIEEGKIDHFYEVLFHILNLNNLAVNGNLFTAKFKEVWKGDRIRMIQEDLKHIYDLPKNTAHIFKNAHYVFLNILIDYMKTHLTFLDKIHILNANENIHLEKQIFVVTNVLNTLDYTIWYLEEDIKRNFGYSFKKIKKVKVEELKPNSFIELINKDKDSKLDSLSSQKNVCFVIHDKEDDPKLIANIVKDSILLNKGIAKAIEFEPYLMIELYKHIVIEKIMPFTLDQWKFENAKEL